MDKVNVVSFSGGRTSAKLVAIMEGLRKAGKVGPVKYIFMDTGAEHPKTYDFIRNCGEYFGIDLVCLRPVFSTEKGVGVNYKVVGLDEIGCDLEPWRGMLAAYGTPFNPGGGFCTDRLKTVCSDKYCKDNFGKDLYKWIGYRSDEAKRAWGHTLYTKLLGLGLDNDSAKDLLMDALKQDDLISFFERSLIPVGDMFGASDNQLLIALEKKIKKIRKIGFRFMFEICDDEKQDILDWWSKQPFDLDIDEWSGNCVFCIKKGENKVALAAKDNPELADQFQAVLEEDTVRVVERKFGPLIMYRGHNSLQSIRDKYANVSREELVASLRGNKSMDTGSCSESCEAYSDQLDLEDL